MGDIRCRLSRILGDRRITQRELVRRTRLSSYTVGKFYNEKWKGVDRHTIIKLCEALSIQVGDLFEYVEMGEKPKKGRK
jgi:putative transcriptional regulator